MSSVIPKRKVAVRLRLDTGEERRGSLYLDYIDVIHRGEQTLLDKFNDDYPWFPFLTVEGQVEILNRDWVSQVEPGEGISQQLVRKENSPVFRRERVTLTLVDGRHLDGHIAMDLPDEFSRVSDFLNFPQNFFALEAAHGPVLVSKRHVKALTPHEEPPALPGSTKTRIGEKVS
ncbi:MAG TPA: hypothetical protein VFR10_10545 [bacterium]|nr:hypothetical protein [bacterium]